MKKSGEWRKTSQLLLPESKPVFSDGEYDIYPAIRINDNLITEGFESLTEEILKHRLIIIDGYAGVFFDIFREELSARLKKKGKTVSWKNTSDFLKDQEQINDIISPFTGGDDPVFGCRSTLSLEDFYLYKLKVLSPDPETDLNIIIGAGAALCAWEGFLIYIDLPKNEIQFRARAGSITNLGSDSPFDPKAMYKRFYFFDWVVLNKHKQSILPYIDIIVDSQNPENTLWMTGDEFRSSLTEISRNVFRVRPWFEPGVWGGKWILEHIKGLNCDVPNYAWSFELISPENGILLESSGKMMEVSFDFLMYQEGENILGDCYKRFGTEFPIRFDFLDTFEGDNLSIQCHPRPEYMKKHFGENFTQEETYYILDTKDNAVVYLGFQNDIDSNKFQICSY